MNIKFYNMKQIVYLFVYVFKDRMVLLLKIKGYDLIDNKYMWFKKSNSQPLSKDRGKH